MISGLTILSNAVDMKYPFIEAIESWLEVCDEMVCVVNPLGTDGTEEILKNEFDGIRIVYAPFDLDRWGRISYGIMRTSGYYACNGDIVLTFDADGVLHENNIDLLKLRLNELQNDRNHPIYYWKKLRFYRRDLCYDQWKHKGIYNKRLLADSLHFYGASGVDKVAGGKFKTKQIDVPVYGYEHLWDTKKALYGKICRYGRMIDRQLNKEYKEDDEYIEQYLDDLKNKLKSDGRRFDVSNHPKVMRDKLNEIDNSCFGNNLFGLL